jgi:glutamate synthase (NADPH) small chain
MKLDEVDKHQKKLTRDPLNFLQLKRETPEKRSNDTRRIDFKEIYNTDLGYHSANQAARCLDCGNPYCEWKCPLHNYIPNWLDYVANEKYQQAAELMYETNPLPEICGRVCPQDRLCEQACTLNTGFGAVTIGAIEKNITDRAIANKWRPTVPELKSEAKRVAIIGAGPAGLACADQLARHGVKAVVFDKYPEIGGLLTFGIPGFKLEKDVIRKRRAFLQDIGVEFRLNTNVGRDIEFSQIQRDFDDVFLAMGTYTSVIADLPGNTNEGVYKALDYLVGNINKIENFKMQNFPLIDLSGKKVVVLGGGDTAMDCVRTAVRQGARAVTCVYRRDQESMPGSNIEVANAKEEGVNFEFCLSPIEIKDSSKLSSDSNTKLSVLFSRTEMRIDSGSGEKSFSLTEQQQRIECDAVIVAFGFKASPASWFTKADIQLTENGLIKPQDGKPSEHGGSLRTSANNIYAGGDMVRGADLVVTAVAEGIKAAKEMVTKYQL